MSNSTTAKPDAIVIGGSIAGLLTAQVLSKYFSQVTIMERDRLPDQPEHRPGVPQGHQIHVLLNGGLNILEGLFPGIQTELIASGAYPINITADFLWYAMGGLSPRFASDLKIYGLSRNLLEWNIRRRVVANNKIKFITSAQVDNFLTNPPKNRVTGVKVQETDFSANLVVDTSGRNSRTPQWLEAMGYTSPKETIVNSFLGYATCLYQIPAGSPLDWQGVYIFPAAPETRGAVILRIEENQWAVCLIGIARDYPPTNQAGFLEFAQSLRSPIIYEAIKYALPLSPIYAYRRTENSWRHYEQLSRMPEGLVVLGDAVCSFNPVYGQGMTTAALGASTLDQCLSTGNLASLSLRCQKELGKIITLPWSMATGEDFRWPTTEGKRPNFLTKLTQKYLDQIILLGAEDQEIYQLFVEVNHFLKPPSVFFQPRVIQQVLGRLAKGAFTNLYDNP